LLHATGIEELARDTGRFKKSISPLGASVHFMQ